MPRPTPLAGLAVCCAALGGCGVAAERAPPRLEIYRHSSWSEVAPKGIDAHGVRRNLAPGETLDFEGLTLTVVGQDGSEAGDRVTLSLEAGPTAETRTAAEGEAFAWGRYRVCVVAVRVDEGELGFGASVLEVATLASLPADVAASTHAGGPEQRLRVRHEIDTLTLHHSATPLTASDDLGRKLRAMQLWGERDRNWFDVPYHFVIGLDGRILEARDHRYAGDTNTRYDTAGHFLVNCFGNYDVQEPNDAQLTAIAKLMAWAALEFGIGAEVLGHRDLARTGCPGDNLYARIADGSLSALIRDAMRAGKPELVWLDQPPTR